MKGTGVVFIGTILLLVVAALFMTLPYLGILAIILFFIHAPHIGFNMSWQEWEWIIIIWLIAAQIQHFLHKRKSTR